MSVYDRAPRKSIPIYGSTSAAIGPGTYEPDVRKQSKDIDGYAPFLSMAVRTSSWAGDNTMAAPGPGHYDLQSAPTKVPGGFGPNATATRFYDAASDIPGPGSYNVLHHDAVKPTHKMPQVTEDGHKSALGSRVKIYRKPEAPSIPTPGQAYGFEENEDGSLVKQDPPMQDKTIGPAFYKPQYKSSQFASAKTSDFGRVSKRPNLFKDNGMPGPGSYTGAESDAAYIMQNYNIRGDDQVRYESHVPRFSDATVINAYKQDFPGPGKYEIKSTLNTEQQKFTTEGLEVEHPPFMSQTTRFKPSKSNSPGPGTYTDPRHALEKINRVTGLKKSPFGQTSVRFDKQHHTKHTPGPGTYNFSGIGADSMRRAYLESTQHGVFGTTSARRTGLTGREDAQLPGPAQYTIREPAVSVKNKFQPLTSNFASLTNRMPEPPSIVTEIPPPTSYDVQKSYENSQVTVARAKPRTRAAHRKQHSFLIGASRFCPVRDAPWKFVDPENPAPCSYDPKNKQHVATALMCKATRFNLHDNGIPGPGAYELPTVHRDTVIKGTFNATLANPIPIVEAPQKVICA